MNFLLKKSYSTILANKSKIKNCLKLSAFALIVNEFNKLQFNNKNKLDCDDSRVDSRYGKESLKDMEESLNRKFEIDASLNDPQKENRKNSIEDIDIPLEEMDESQINEINKALEDPSSNNEMFEQIIMNDASTQPPQFKAFNQAFKCHGDDENWTGLRLGAEYAPTQTFKFDVDTNVTPGQPRNPKYSLFAVMPFKSDPNKALVLVGRNDNSFVHSIQSHITLSKNDKISIVSNYKKNDINQHMFDAEYVKALNRLNITAKYSNMSSSLACTTNVWKSLHLGVEANMTPKSELMYSYAISYKPIKKIGVSLMYLSYMPMFSLDMMYNHNKEHKMYFTYSKNYNPMIAMTGASPVEVKINHEMKPIENLQIITGLNQSMMLNGTINYKINKNLTVTGNFEMFPANVTKRRQKIFKNFGVGIVYNHNSFEELMNVEEDFSEYEYEKL